ncbi:hypothetical protein INT47_009284 [Mucor saturninus]|uniref:Uncharacterized protein n=1 Tax=Mucor saturninus TaxID=64648 RepID=A0A8H7V1J2_9FUNG|nr:hypothetical protein INT47_009284 [Mucor saturninus]
MILRPSKIFVSFHQLRHYFTTKISELVATSHQQPSNTVTRLNNYSTTQQSILFFSDIQRSLIQKAYHFQQPTKRNPLNDKLLLKVIQQHFPIVKVFSNPTLHGRSMMTVYPSQQLRTMMSTSGGSGGGATFMTWGLPRSAMVGVGRSNGFNATRQFSTTKSPTCVTFFQTTAPQQPNVFAHISSRIFSPAGTKMSQPPTADEKPKFVPFYSLEKDVSTSDEESICSTDFGYNRMFQHKANKGMGDLVNIQECKAEKKLYVGRETANTRRNKRSMKKLDSIVRHDDVSASHGSRKPIVSNKRKLHSSAAIRHGRIKHPPDRQEPKANAFILIDLDSTPFMSGWSTQSLDSNFIDSVEIIAHNYQLHIHHVLNLLDRLRYSGKKFRVVSRNSELRIYFPSCAIIRSKTEAIEFLKRLNVDQDEEHYSIVVDKCDENNASAEIDADYFKDLQMFLDRTDYLIEKSSSTFSSRKTI